MPVLNILLILLAGGALFWFVRSLILILRSGYLRGRVILLTGASRGIGRELAKELTRYGARLALAARSEDGLAETAAQCKLIDPEVETFILSADVTSEADCQRMVKQTLKHYGRIDMLINNAGIIQGGDTGRYLMEDARRLFEVNVFAALRLTQIALPHLLENRGTLVLMASAAGRHAYPFFTVYSMTKHALVGFGAGLRRETMGKLRVLIINPGYTDTDEVKVIEPAYRKMGFRMIPPALVARRTVEGLLTNEVEVQIGPLETFGQYTAVLFPFFSDLFWRILMPREYPDLAEKQKTE
jgi:short-subunit dehydrogenase